MDYINFFCHERFSDRLLVFGEAYSMVHRFTIGCFVGDNAVLIIDAGLGMTKDMRRYIESVLGQGRKIICACTNGRMDHVGSACLFDEAYCSELDFANGENPFDPIKRYCELVDYALENNIVMDYARQEMIMENACPFRNVKDGDTFDLGGIVVEAIAVPGTTPGSMAYYCAAERVCFTGDAINTDVDLTVQDLEGIASYGKTMRDFLSRVEKDTVIWPYHLPLPMTTAIAENLAVISGEIADGRIDRDPPTDRIFHGYNNDRNIRGHYYNNTCIVYDRKRIGLQGVRMDYLNCCYYSHEKWSDRVYTITINNSTVNRITLMVFVGDEKILLIDSGHGIDGKLKSYVQEIVGCDKPILLACTHVGIDHAGGAILFDEVYLHPLDIAKLPLSRNKRLVDVQPFSNYNKEFEEYTTEFMLDPIDPKDCIPIADGDQFHLGNLDVECIFTPGHSTGHMAFYCASEKVCFTGDAMNVDTHLGGTDRQFFRDYAKMLQNFMDRVDPDTVLFSAHLNRPNGMRVPRHIQSAVLEIAENQTYGDQPGEAIQKHIGKYKNPHFKMHYHGLCVVCYMNTGLAENELHKEIR